MGLGIWTKVLGVKVKVTIAIRVKALILGLVLKL
jgi:hypothetical protein